MRPSLKPFCTYCCCHSPWPHLGGGSHRGASAASGCSMSSTRLDHSGVSRRLGCSRIWRRCRGGCALYGVGKRCATSQHHRDRRTRRHIARRTRAYLACPRCGNRASPPSRNYLRVGVTRAHVERASVGALSWCRCSTSQRRHRLASDSSN